MLKQQHLPSLDGLRGLAVLMVIAHNVQMFDPVPPGWTNQAIQMLFNFGWMGVQLFFVLSGFLITGILLDSRDEPHQWRNFMARRVLRIFPLYYGTLLVLFVVLPWLGWQPEAYRQDVKDQLWEWLYLENWSIALGNESTLPHFWSLAVEEQFYLVWPLVLIWQRSSRQVLVISLLLAGASLVVRLYMVGVGMSAEAIYVTTPSRMDALSLGAAAACLLRDPTLAPWLRQHHTRWLRGVLALTCVAFLLTHGFPRISPLGQTIGYFTLSVLFSAMIMSAVLGDSAGSSHRWHEVLKLSALASVGRYSYGMYIIHKPLHDTFSHPAMRRLGIQTAGSFTWAGLHVAATMLISYVAALLSYHLLEVHFLKLKRHFISERAPA